MTNNIVAQFACSLDSNGNFKEYRVVSGSVFNEEYNETLDSATIVLSQVSKEDRLTNIKPYQYVRVYDKSGNTGFDRLFLVDNFDEKENNIKEHIFGYTINLMSETKWLEKIQCPNLVITHEVNNGTISKKTIYQHIKQYMELYVPKIKFSGDGETWRYEPLIKLPLSDVEDGSLLVNYYDDNFTLVSGHGQDYYEFSCESGQLSDNVDWETAEVVSVSANDEDVEWLGEFVCSFNSTTGKFDVSNTSRNSYYGSLTITYKYKQSVIGTEFYERFNSSCADLSFNAPTLRQLLTMLMQQVGCIPIVRNRTLGFLDFQKQAASFGDGDYTLDNTVNFIHKSLSSDSYVNTLVNMSSNVLDSENKVYCEALGFRDISKNLLKQQENLYLETRFPIFKVENFIMNAYVKSDINIKNIQSTLEAGVGSHIAAWSITSNVSGEGQLTLDFTVSFPSSLDTSLKVEGNVTGFSYKSSSTVIRTLNRLIRSNTYVPGETDVFNLSFPVNCDKFYFNGVLTVSDETNQQSASFSVFYCNFAKDHINYLCLYSQNITKLLLETSIRQQLNTNFKDMVNESNSPDADLDTLAKYVYGTLGYSIGSTRISGFSDAYNVGQSTVLGWINVGYTYLENIWNFITSHYTESITSKIVSDFGNIPLVTSGTQKSFEVNSIYPYNPFKQNDPNLARIFSSDINFSCFWFDITYQPLNSFNLSYVKKDEDIDIPIAQYDGNASGLTDFDRLSIHEQEQVDRIGNETLSISQRTMDFDQIQTFENGPLAFKDNAERGSNTEIDYIIFKRSFTINNNCFNASYVGSKDAVLKDYFTSIRTKYRAYQYVDYSQSVLRKERDVFYVKISDKGWYDGDDKIFFGEFTFENKANQQGFIYKIVKDIPAQTRYSVLSDSLQSTKNDISLIQSKNMMAIISEEADNVGSGTYISLENIENAIDYGKTNSALYGGIPQTWQIWNDEYNTKHIVSYVSNLNIKNIFESYMDTSVEAITDIQEDFSKVLALPILSDDFVDLFSDSIKNVVFSVVDDNKHATTYPYYCKTFYKDLSERINYSVQFIAYTDSKNILWNKNYAFDLGNLFTAGSITNYDFVPIEDDEDFKINEEEYEDSTTPHTPNNGYVTFSESVSGSNPYFLVHWNMIAAAIHKFKLSRITVQGNKTIRKDIMAFKRNGDEEQKFYITLNDTKTDYVMSERNGVLYRRYVVKQNQSIRQVEKIYNEPED